MADQYWVTWPDISDSNQARDRALIWGPQPKPPPQVTSPVRMFQAGPFATKADAQKYKDSIGTGKVLPPGGTPVVGSSGRGTTQTIENANPLAGLEGIAHIMGDFFSGITDGKMWRSLGWLTLGIVLFLGGLALWLKGSLNPLALATGGGHAASNLKGMFGRG